MSLKNYLDYRYNHRNKKRRGSQGLTAAIILIAFIITAAGISFVILTGRRDDTLHDGQVGDSARPKVYPSHATDCVGISLAGSVYINVVEPTLFEDIAGLTDVGIREILKIVDKNALMVALKGTSDDLRDKFLGNMSKRAQDAFLEEMEFMGAVKVKEVEESQRQIVDEVQKLAEQGIIQLGDNEEMVE